MPDSSRMPPTLAPSSRMSFGHLHETRRPVTSRMASAMQAPASSDSRPARAGGSAGLSTSEKSSAPSGTSVQVRPTRPRPSVWCAADTSVHSGLSSLARATASALVDPVTSSARTGAATGIAPNAPRRSSSVSTLSPSGAGYPWKARYASDEAEAPDRQPWGDRGPDHPHVSRDGDHVGRDLLRRGPRRVARRARGRVLPCRARTRERLVPFDRRDPRGSAEGQDDAGPSRLWVPGGAGAVRAGGRGSGLHVRRAVGTRDRTDGRQG